MKNLWYEIGFCMTAVFLVSCSDRREAYEVTYREIHEAVYASGILMPEDYRFVRSTRANQIWQIAVEEGEEVKAGDLLLVLGSEGEREQRSLLRQQISLLQEQQVASSSRIRELQRQLEHAKQVYEKDSVEADDLAVLAKEGAVSRQIANEAAIKASSSLTQKRRLEEQLGILRDELKDKELGLRQQLAGVTQSGDADEIRSPFDGKVHAVLHKASETVPAMRNLVLIGHPTDFMLELLLDERDVQRVKAGQKVYFETDVAEGEIFEAELLKVNPMMERESRSFLVEAKVVGNHSLFPNASVEANILIRSEPKALVIPVDFLLEGDSVMSESGERSKVTTGIRTRDYVQITNGLDEGDIIIKK